MTATPGFTAAAIVTLALGLGDTWLDLRKRVKTSSP